MGAAEIAPLLWTAALLLVLLAWPLRRCKPAIALVALAVFALPALQPMTPVGWKVFVTLAVGAFFPPKLLDLALGPPPTFRDWARFVLHPATLVWRRHGAEPMRPAFLLLVRSAMEMASGAALLMWAREESMPFWVEHTVKLVAGYLLVLDGGIQLVTALCRFAGSRVIDGSIHPVAAVTPADFWRRYNRVAGQFFYEDVFKPVAGRRFLLGVAAVFFVNGLLHEYLATMIVGRVTGLQMAFFALQGLGVALTHRLRPRGAMIPLAVAATFAFNVAASVLFFKSFDPAVAWYHRAP